METIEVMRTFYNTLSEKDKRRYTVTEAVKLGHGGVSYIDDTPGCARRTIHIRNRRTEIDAAFLDVVENHTADNPMEPNLCWTNLTHTDIAQRLSDDFGICVSKSVVPQSLRKHSFVRRKAQKRR